jgi:hypothetical protein
MTTSDNQHAKTPKYAILKELFLFVFPLPVFFVLHRWNDVKALVSFSDCLPSLCILLVLSLVVFFVARLMFRNWQKASLFSVAVLSVFLFYPFNDLANAHVPLLERPLLSFLLLVIISFLFFLLLLRIKHYPVRLKKFLTILLTALISFEIILLLYHGPEKSPSPPAPFFQKKEVASRQMARPPVYVILMDEYAGTDVLKKYASFDNQFFCSQLQSLGFSVINHPKSNYRYTIYSVASLLNGDYNPYPAVGNYTPSLSRITHNRVVSSFHELGYDFINISPFTIHEQQRFYKYFFLPANSDLILKPTILDDIIEFLPFFITRRLPDKYLFEKLVNQKAAFNKKVLERLMVVSMEKKTAPVFCYTHVMMPHGFYARDSSGNINTPFLTNLNIQPKDKQDAYLQYLAYTNKTILPYMSQLKKNTGDSAIILLISDHGSRDIAAGKDKALAFPNFAAVYYPKGMKMNWYDSISNVNFFRVLLSDISGKKVGLLKDSVIIR